jgi:hypothetical protein
MEKEEVGTFEQFGTPSILVIVICCEQNHIMWVPVTMAWYVLGLWMDNTVSSYGRNL